jgi:homoserine kinase
VAVARPVASPPVPDPVRALRARCPASSANLGPGFDTLAVALALHVEVEVRPADRLIVRAEGEGCDLPADQTHLAARVAIDVTGTEGLDITVRSQIPVARGLGSSAALAAAAAAAAGSDDPLGVATAVDGHAENAAASVLGGLVTATLLGPHPVAARLPLDAGLAFVVLVPGRPLLTHQARLALPETVLHEDATFNLGRMGLLLAGLADRRRLVREATEDRLHQQQRTPLFPEAPVILAGLLNDGALAACWSGSGPTLLAICDHDEAPAVRDAGERLLAESNVAGRAVTLEADTTGLVVEAL